VSLREYQDKRRFATTPEPAGAPQSRNGPLRFVVQKHRASHLHFDLRLEVDGALKSWAVPKGPPVGAEKRLAILVEDHPLDYVQFEGVIPSGNYGAGTVMVWDTGTYHAPGIAERGPSEQAVAKGLEEGQFHVVLHGRKLRGEFILVHPKRGKENEWLWFIKDATAPAATDDDVSVLSNRTMEQIARRAPAGEFDSLAGINLNGAARAPKPREIRPMLATAVDHPFDDPNWLFEVKWDGYRAIAHVEPGRARLTSRNRLPFNRQFTPIVAALEHLGHDAILDGEIVVLDREGRPKFRLLQNYQKSKQGTLVYEVFDALYLDGHDLRGLPLVRRKEIVNRLVKYLPKVLVSEHIQEHGRAFFNAVAERKLEGVVAKDGRSRYQGGVRNKSWLKIKTHMRQEAIICGFTLPKPGLARLKALVLGVYEKGRLTYIGNAGSGFSDRDLVDLPSRFMEFGNSACPFQVRPKTNAPVQWLEPRLVCEVSFLEWTEDGQMRHPVYEGLREDRDPSEIHREVEELVDEAQVSETKKAKPIAPSAAAVTKPSGNPGQKVTLTNLKKVYWPEEGFTKGDLIDYYREVSEFILPYLKDRPESLHRHPNGIEGKSFFQKDMRSQPPPAWVQTVELDSDKRKALTLLCQDSDALLYMANLGCIEVNPWNSRIGALERPDYLLIDLDPENVPFDHVVQTAQLTRKLLEDLDAEVFCKTSGKRGLHLYVPLGALYNHDQARDFAHLIARLVNAKLPAITSLTRDPALRQGRVYLDFLQNGQGKTLAAPYCVRPYRGATVSAPLKWSEVREGLDPSRFSIRTMKNRLDVAGDLWKGVLGPGIDLQASLERLTGLFNKAGR
jgi:bifunctional non-homologous end joining protein LigD